VADPDSPYDVLGLTPRASEADIRARHRRLVRENHPDVLSGAGVPKDLLIVADRKVAAINAAFDAIALERGFKRGQPTTADP
jgi:DnaJ like chaperone protein